MRVNVSRRVRVCSFHSCYVITNSSDRSDIRLRSISYLLWSCCYYRNFELGDPVNVPCKVHLSINLYPQYQQGGMPFNLHPLAPFGLLQSRANKGDRDRYVWGLLYAVIYFELTLYPHMLLLRDKVRTLTGDLVTFCKVILWAKIVQHLMMSTSKSCHEAGEPDKHATRSVL